MNWDDKAYEYAEARSSEYFGCLSEQMFEHGAKWQRDQLRTNEAVERVALVLHARMYDTLAEIAYPTGALVAESVATEARYRRLANARALSRTVTTALLGEDQ